MTLLAVVLVLAGTPLIIAALILVWFARHPGQGSIPPQRTRAPNTRVVVSPAGVGFTRRIGPARFSTSGRGAVRLGSRVTGVFRWR